MYNPAQDPNHLSIKINPKQFFLFVILFLGIAALMQLMRISDQFTCTRGSPSGGECTYAHKELDNNSRDTFPIAEIENARLLTYTTDSGRETYLVQVVTENDYHNITGGYSRDLSRNTAVLDQVNAFLQDDSQQNLLITTQRNTLSYVLSAVFVVLALVMLLFPSSVTLDLDRRTGLASVRRKSLVSSRKIEIPLRDLAGAEVQVSSSTRNNFTYRVALVHQDGRRTPLTSYFSSGPDPKNKMATEINQFLYGPSAGAGQAPISFS